MFIKRVHLQGTTTYVKIKSREGGMKISKLTPGIDSFIFWKGLPAWVCFNKAKKVKKKR
jgi:hypothetical protein